MAVHTHTLNHPKLQTVQGIQKTPKTMVTLARRPSSSTIPKRTQRKRHRVPAVVEKGDPVPIAMRPLRAKDRYSPPVKSDGWRLHDRNKELDISEVTSGTVPRSRELSEDNDKVRPFPVVPGNMTR